jgi:hypothetical protein
VPCWQIDPAAQSGTHAPDEPVEVCIEPVLPVPFPLPPLPVTSLVPDEFPAPEPPLPVPVFEPQAPALATATATIEMTTRAFK